MQRVSGVNLSINSKASNGFLAAKPESFGFSLITHQQNPMNNMYGKHIF